MAFTYFNRIRFQLKPLLSLTMLASLAGAVALPAEIAAQADFVAVPSQPTNVGDAKTAALAYHDSGAYDHDLAVVAGEARRWLARRAQAVTRPALVLDIDETALSNWEIIKLDDFGRPIEGPCSPGSGAPCGWAAWDQLGRDPAIQPTLDVFQRARALKTAVFFITGRPESQRAATERNLVAAGCQRPVARGRARPRLG